MGLQECIFRRENIKPTGSAGSKTEQTINLHNLKAAPLALSWLCTYRSWALLTQPCISTESVPGTAPAPSLWQHSALSTAWDISRRHPSRAAEWVEGLPLSCLSCSSLSLSNSCDTRRFFWGEMTYKYIRLSEDMLSYASQKDKDILSLLLRLIGEVPVRSQFREIIAVR